MNKLLQVSLGTLLLAGILSFNHAHSSDEENIEEFPPIEWLVEDEGGASENYYLSNSEKKERLDVSWEPFYIDGNRAKINFPWKPDEYEIPHTAYGIVKSECVSRMYISDIENSYMFAANTIFCSEYVSSTLDIERRMKSAKMHALKNKRTLIYEKNLNMKCCSGLEMLVKDSFGYYVKTRFIAHDKTVYVISVSVYKDKEKLDSTYVNRYLDSWQVNSEKK